MNVDATARRPRARPKYSCFACFIMAAGNLGGWRLRRPQCRVVPEPSTVALGLTVGRVRDVVEEAARVVLVL